MSRKPYKKLHNAENLIQAIIDMLVNNMTQLKAEFAALSPREKFYFIERVLPAVNKFIEIERATEYPENSLEHKQSEIELLIKEFQTSKPIYA